MVLQKRQIIIPFAQGTDQKVDEKHRQQVKLDLVENGQFDKVGAINKRQGFTEISASLDTANTSVGKIVSLNSREDELIAVIRQRRAIQAKAGDSHGWKVYSLDRSSVLGDTWRELGRHVPLELKIDSIGRPEASWIAPDMAETAGFRCYVWASDISAPFLDTGSPYCSIKDTVTGALVVDAYDWGGAITTVRTPKVVAVDDTFHVWICPGNAWLSLNNAGTPTVIGGFVSKTPGDVHADKLWDACYCGSGPGGVECSVIAYKDTTPDIKVRWFREDGTQVAVQTITCDPVNVVSCARLYCHDADEYYIGVFWQDNSTNDIYGYLYNEDSTVHWAANQAIIPLGAVTALNITAIEDPSILVATPAASSLRVFAEIEGTYPPWSNYIVQGHYRFDEVGGAVDTTFYNACLASKAIEYGDKARVWTTNAQKIQGAIHLRSNIGSGETDYIINTDIKALQDKGQNYSTRYPGLPQIVKPVVESLPFHFATVLRNRLSELGFGSELHAVKSIIDMQFTFEDQETFLEAKIGPNLQLAGGLVGEVDGRYIESGFHLYPELDPTGHGNTPPFQLPAPPANQYAVVGAGGYLTGPGDFYFRFTYEWTDREGQLHKSAPSPVYIVTLGAGANQLICFRIPYLHYGALEKLPDVVLCTYRLASDGVYHKEDVILDNLLTRGFVDTAVTVWPGGSTSDANLLDNEILYTEGGSVDHIGPPASNIIAARKDRVFLIPDEDRQAVWYSLLKRSGEGLAFNDLFIKRIPTSGDGSAIGLLDDKVIIFKENEIRAFSGPGPNDAGVGSFSEDFLVAQDIGCIDRGSVENTEKGITFMSKRGHYLLTRSLQTQYIGSGVDDYKADTVNKTLSVPEKNQIRFIHNGYILMFDSLVGQWSKFTHDSIVSGTMWQNNFTHYDTSWKVYEEANLYRDDGVDIEMKLETSWLKLAGIQGYQRIFWVGLLGDYKSPHTLTVEIMYNYDTAIAQTIQLTADAAFGADVPYQMRFRPRFSRCQAIKFRIYDEDHAAAYESYSISGLSLIIGVKPGLYRDKPSRTLGA
jgi:hypothetical protein